MATMLPMTEFAYPAYLGASLMLNKVIVRRCAYNPATETPRPVAYKRQNFLTHSALVSDANADTGGALPVVEPHWSSVIMVLRFSSDMACVIWTDVGLYASVERCFPKDWILSIARRKPAHIADNSLAAVDSRVCPTSFAVTTTTATEIGTSGTTLAQELGTSGVTPHSPRALFSAIHPLGSTSGWGTEVVPCTYPLTGWLRR